MPFLKDDYEEYENMAKPTGMTTEQEKLWEAAQNNNRKLRTDYSGRGMFGKTCWGIVCDDPIDTISEIGIKGAKTDSMGYSAIVYWPNITGPITSN